MGGDVPSPARLGQARAACRSILSPPALGQMPGEGTGEQIKLPLSSHHQNSLHVNYALIIECRLPPINYGSVTVCSLRRCWVIFVVSLQLHSYSHSSACAFAWLISSFKQSFF